jgi:hypothetical protein
VKTLTTTIRNELAQRARETAHALAPRLAVANAADFPRGFGGHAGYATAWLALHQDDPRVSYEQQWHAAMRSAATHSAKDSSLANGIAGLRAATALSMASEPRYSDLLEKCNARLATVLSSDITLKNFGDYDLIAGPAGALAALAVAPGARAVFMTHRLAELCGDDPALALLHPLQKGTPMHDLGTAHGIFGLCAAVAMHADLLNDTARATITGALRQAIHDVVDVNGVAMLRPWREAEAMSPAQNAWCYGIPGAASAILSTAEAFADDSLSDWALSALHTLAPYGPDDVSENAGLCHGSAGIAICLLRAAQRDERLQPMLTAYVEATIQRARLGQFDMEFGGDDVYNGVPGVIIALLTFAGSFTPDWVRLFAAAVPA